MVCGPRNVRKLGRDDFMRLLENSAAINRRVFAGKEAHLSSETRQIRVGFFCFPALVSLGVMCAQAVMSSFSARRQRPLTERQQGTSRTCVGAMHLNEAETS